ncbi:MAG: hypothetical protein KUL79_02220 [Thauera sp.]|nr:hypothetical protein [Thauera sp.]
MDKACHELRVCLDRIHSLTAPDGDAPGGTLPGGIAEELLAQARAADERAQLAIRFVAPDADVAFADAACADAIVTRVHTHFARVAQRHTLQIRDIFRFARVSSAVGLLCVVVLLACAQAIPDEAGKLMNGVRESLNIFAWVAMWRPAELWLYAHLPERHWRRLALRLAQARVSVESTPAVSVRP